LDTLNKIWLSGVTISSDASLINIHSGLTAMKFTTCIAAFLTLTVLLLNRPVYSGVPDDPAAVSSIVLLKPSGKEFKGFPVLEIMPSGDPGTGVMKELLENSFLREMAALHQLVENDLSGKGIISVKEPMYLLASGRMGGFPMNGFFLKTGKKLIDKRNVPYVDLMNLNQNYKRLGSVTQIFPHEQAHLYFRLFSGIDPEKIESFSSDVHYFSITTNYLTAFNEGFAESFENISRVFETNPAISGAVRKDTTRLKSFLGSRIKGFDRDFRWPGRLGLYRLTMLLWYQDLEDYKRYAWSLDGSARFWPLTLNGSPVEKRLLYRNAGVLPDKRGTRSSAGCSSNEGVINAFFTQLMISHAGNCNRQDSSLSPVQNQLMKEFNVIYKYLRGIPPGASLFDAFISGYITEYPSEKQIILNVYRQVCGFDFTGNAAPEIWLFNPDHRHNPMVMAQFGGCSIPYYTMNLNTAQAEDLMTFPGVDKAKADEFVACRDSSGFFQSIGDLEKLPARLHETGILLKGAVLHPHDLDKYNDEESFSLKGLFTSILNRFLMLNGFLFLGIFSLTFLLFGYRRKPVYRSMGMAARALFKSILFLLAVVGIFFLPYPPVYLFLAFIAVILLINILRTRNNPAKRKEIVFSSALLGVLIIYSLI